MLNLPQNPKWDIARVSHSTLVNADCFDVFPFIEDKSIDAIICDLPYGITQCKWDSILPLDKLWKEYERVIKPNGVIILFGSQPFTTKLISSNYNLFRYELIYGKTKSSNFMQAKKQPLKTHENILVFYKKLGTYNPQMTKAVVMDKRKKEKQYFHKEGSVSEGQKTFRKVENGLRYPTSSLLFNNSDKTKNEHPTQKPLELMEYLIKTYTNEGDMVLDNTMGSGTTNLACLKLNRKSIGIEKEKQYYDVAVRRLSSYCG